MNYEFPKDFPKELYVSYVTALITYLSNEWESVPLSIFRRGEVPTEIHYYLVECFLRKECFPNAASGFVEKFGVLCGRTDAS